MDIKYYINKARDVNLKDYLDIFPMIAALLLTPFRRRQYTSKWVVAERKEEACDNGYSFYKFMRRAHSEIPCVYVIDKKCKDYSKVKNLGETVQYGSVRHWLLYFCSKYLISSQSGKPSPYLCTAIERLGLYRPCFVFLQHGITINKAPYLMPGQMYANVFITGAAQEKPFLEKELNYSESTVKYTGFARFDELHNTENVPGRIMVMPTWRKWLRFRSEEHDDVSKDINESEYFLRWEELLQSDKLTDLIDKYNLEVVFVPHPNFKKTMDVRRITGSRIRTIDELGLDIPALMRTSEALITDYSSVFFDMAYMKKPVIFYQFDLEQFRKYHYPEGWFDYEHSALANQSTNAETVLESLESLLEKGFFVDKAFLEEHALTFPLYDCDNCKRIYEILMQEDMTK